MSRILFLVCFLFSSNVGANEVAIQNDQPPRRQVLLFEHMQTTHTDFSINIPNENVSIQASYFNQVDITGGQWTRAVVHQAAEIFIIWANERGFELSSNGRRNIDLYVYDVHIETLNDKDIMHYSDAIKSGSGDITGLYDTKSINGTNIIFISANNERSGSLRAGTIAHELAHFLCDYFRIYDNYFENFFGGYDFEGPAYDFQHYFSRRTRH
jgi:hypothetical protein